MKAATKSQQKIWDKGLSLYDDFLEYMGYMHDPNARKIARTPRTNTLEAFVAAKNRKTLNGLMLSEYRSNKESESPCFGIKRTFIRKIRKKK